VFPAFSFLSLDHLFETSQGLLTGHPPGASSACQTGHEIPQGCG
jgi:hypothetical protein